MELECKLEDVQQSLFIRTHLRLKNYTNLKGVPVCCEITGWKCGVKEGETRGEGWIARQQGDVTCLWSFACLGVRLSCPNGVPADIEWLVFKFRISVCILGRDKVVQSPFGLGY